MSYGVHLSHKVIQKVRQFQMVHFVFEKVIRRDNNGQHRIDYNVCTEPKKYFRCIEWFYHQISIPDLFTFHEEHEIHWMATIFEIWLSCSCFSETGVLGDLVYKRKKHLQERSPTWSGSVRRPSGTPGPGSNRNSLDARRFTRWSEKRHWSIPSTP